MLLNDYFAINSEYIICEKIINIFQIYKKPTSTPSQQTDLDSHIIFTKFTFKMLNLIIKLIIFNDY